MDNKVPIRLKKEPLLEVIWEIRFSGTKTSIADLLPGMLFKALPDRYRNIVRLAAADIPAPIVEKDLKLRYVPQIRLEGDNQAIQIGNHVVSLNCRRPYSGWIQFSSDIRELAKAVQETGLVERLERFSLKYIDLIELEKPVGLSCLNVDLKLGEHETSTKPVQLRTEIKENDLLHIIQIVSPAEVLLPEMQERLKGVLLDIDTIKLLDGKESWSELDKWLDDVHMACKKMFFSLMKPETVDKLEPEYRG